MTIIIIRSPLDMFYTEVLGDIDPSILESMRLKEGWHHKDWNYVKHLKRSKKQITLINLMVQDVLSLICSEFNYSLVQSTVYLACPENEHFILYFLQKPTSYVESKVHVQETIDAEDFSSDTKDLYRSQMKDQSTETDYDSRYDWGPVMSERVEQPKEESSEKKSRKKKKKKKKKAKSEKVQDQSVVTDDKTSNEIASSENKKVLFKDNLTDKGLDENRTKSSELDNQIDNKQAGSLHETDQPEVTTTSQVQDNDSETPATDNDHLKPEEQGRDDDEKQKTSSTIQESIEGRHEEENIDISSPTKCKPPAESSILDSKGEQIEIGTITDDVDAISETASKTETSISTDREKSLYDDSKHDVSTSTRDHDDITKFPRILLKAHSGTSTELDKENIMLRSIQREIKLEMKSSKKKFLTKTTQPTALATEDKQISVTPEEILKDSLMQSQSQTSINAEEVTCSKPDTTLSSDGQECHKTPQSIEITIQSDSCDHLEPLNNRSEVVQPNDLTDGDKTQQVNQEKRKIESIETTERTKSTPLSEESQTETKQITEGQKKTEFVQFTAKYPTEERGFGKSFQSSYIQSESPGDESSTPIDERTDMTRKLYLSRRRKASRRRKYDLDEVVGRIGRSIAKTTTSRERQSTSDTSDGLQRQPLISDVPQVTYVTSEPLPKSIFNYVIDIPKKLSQKFSNFISGSWSQPSITSSRDDTIDAPSTSDIHRNLDSDDAQPSTSYSKQPSQITFVPSQGTIRKSFSASYLTRMRRHDLDKSRPGTNKKYSGGFNLQSVEPVATTSYYVESETSESKSNNDLRQYQINVELPTSESTGSDLNRSLSSSSSFSN